MKINISLVITGCVCGLLLTVQSGFAQGSLIPPGAPAPTMKTLAQIEPRTPISSAPFTITQPGSYYLATNLTVTGGDGIDINTNEVTLDLDGFAISSTSTSANGYGINLMAPGGNNDITILNGHIKGGVTNNNAGIFSGPGFAYGIYYYLAPANVRVSGVSISGCSIHGIYLAEANSTLVESCIVKAVGMYGIYADNVSHCTVVDCGYNGIYAVTASDCYSVAIGNGDGIDASIANNCYGASSNAFGISAGMANNCFGYASGSGGGLFANSADHCAGSAAGSGAGLSVNSSYGIAIGSYGYSVSGIGLSAYIANSCSIEGGTTNVTYKYNMP